jgi:hypothetical protein
MPPYPKCVSETTQKVTSVPPRRARLLAAVADGAAGDSRGASFFEHAASATSKMTEARTIGSSHEAARV